KAKRQQQCFNCAKAKRQQQCFNCAKAKRQQQMFSVAKAKRQLQSAQWNGNQPHVLVMIYFFVFTQFIEKFSDQAR
ncbi:hypothetical protein, partial [Lysinibacillus sp. NPDC059133]|uniref:hypothetical protein n=1 Tax=Lysinibacillus sp. NPDC059133 TaxID=3346737 RepID=UPI0036C7F4AF